MGMRQTLFTVDSHTMGEPTRVVVGGLPNIPGDTMADKLAYAKKNLNHIRTALLYEPRGHRDMFGAIITSPISREADLGVLYMDSEVFLNMCGHGTIGVVTTAIETGMVKVEQPVAKVVLDTPTGLVTCLAHVENGRVTSVTFQNVPAFHYGTHLVEVPKYGPITVDISFGGNFFAIVKAEELGIEIVPSNSYQLIKLGLVIRESVNQQVKVVHPELKHIDAVEITGIYRRVSPNHYQNVVILGAGQVDRSPCGTGTCAQLANLHHWGQLEIGQEIINESIINTQFIGKIVGVTKLGSTDAVIPQVTGRAFITGYHQFVIDPDDPLQHGFWVG